MSLWSLVSVFFPWKHSRTLHTQVWLLHSVTLFREVEVNSTRLVVMCSNYSDVSQTWRSQLWENKKKSKSGVICCRGNSPWGIQNSVLPQSWCAHSAACWHTPRWGNRCLLWAGWRKGWQSAETTERERDFISMGRCGGEFPHDSKVCSLYKQSIQRQRITMDKEDLF